MLLCDDHGLIICDMIICLIIYLCDHCFGYLLTQSMALCQSVALWTRLHQDLTPRKWSKQERCGKVMRVAPFRVCHSLLVKGGIRYGALVFNLCGCSNLIYCVVVALRRLG